MSMDADAEKDVMNGGSGLKGDEKTDEVVEVDSVDTPYKNQDESASELNKSAFYSVYRPQRTDSPRTIRISQFEERVEYLFFCVVVLLSCCLVVVFFYPCTFKLCTWCI